MLVVVGVQLDQILDQLVLVGLEEEVPDLLVVLDLDHLIQVAVAVHPPVGHGVLVVLV
jgi:hypothetical protein